MGEHNKHGEETNLPDLHDRNSKATARSKRMGEHLKQRKRSKFSDLHNSGDDHDYDGDAYAASGPLSSSDTIEAAPKGMKPDSNALSGRQTTGRAVGFVSADAIAHDGEDHAFSYSGESFKIGHSVFVPASKYEPSAAADILGEESLMQRKVSPRGVVSSGGFSSVARFRQAFRSDRAALHKTWRYSSKCRATPKSGQVTMCTFDASDLIDEKDTFTWNGAGKRKITKELRAALPPMNHLLQREEQARADVLVGALGGSAPGRRLRGHRKSCSVSVDWGRSAKSAMKASSHKPRRRSPSASETLFAAL